MLEQRSLAARSGSFAVLSSAFGDGAAVRGAAALSLRRVLDAPWAVSTAHSVFDGETISAAPGPAGRGKEVAIGRS
jgi:hypothetical protein